MKKLLVLLTLILSTTFLWSQDNNNSDKSFTKIEIVPLVKGCKLKKDHVKTKKCVIQKIQKEFFKNLNSGVIDQLGLPAGKYKATVKFTITKTTEIKDIIIKTSVKDHDVSTLKEELIRVTKLLKFKKPGTQNGKAVDVKYTLPMKFETY
jgi:hypothetical protein